MVYAALYELVRCRMSRQGMLPQEMQKQMKKILNGTPRLDGSTCYDQSRISDENMACHPKQAEHSTMSVVDSDQQCSQNQAYMRSERLARKRSVSGRGLILFAKIAWRLFCISKSRKLWAPWTSDTQENCLITIFVVMLQRLYCKHYSKICSFVLQTETIRSEHIVLQRIHFAASGWLATNWLQKRAWPLWQSLVLCTAFLSLSQ